MKNEVKIKVEEFSNWPPEGEDLYYEIEEVSDLKQHVYDLHAMKEMFDIPLSKLFPSKDELDAWQVKG